jgi:thymidylate kinase
VKRPVIIIFEGLSGAGKSTQAAMIADIFGKKGLKVAVDPGANHPAVIAIQNLAKELPFMDHERSVLYWLAWTIKERIIQDYLVSTDADIVIIDRLWGSAIAYNSLIFGQDCNIWQELPKMSLKPDKTFLFIVSRETGLRRKNSPTLRDPKFFQEIRDRYLALAADCVWEIVDGEKPINQTNERLVATLTGLLQQRC